MILLTGAAGFIGSCMLSYLNQQGKTDIIIVDDFSIPKKMKNWEGKIFYPTIHRDELLEKRSWLAQNVTGIIHLGARTDTTSQDASVFQRLNLQYSQMLWQWASDWAVPFLYASSAATYGNGTQGFVDSHEILPQLQPLNLYGDSKHDFDIWALQQEKAPPRWYGFKFFNVYGPNEYHKGRMASVIFHTFQQVQQTGGMKLFRSHRPDYEDGAQSRDFIYVKDVVQTLYYFYQNDINSGLYNLGTGQARTFLDLARSVFMAMGMTARISFIDTPLDIRETYQYFTEADSQKLAAVYPNYATFQSLEKGIQDYVQQYLMPHKYY